MDLIVYIYDNSILWKYFTDHNCDDFLLICDIVWIKQANNFDMNMNMNMNMKKGESGSE